MSCYNASRYLREAVESILNQTYRDFEFLVVNDGSQDDTLAIIQSYARQDDRIVVIDKTNTGLADSLNVGLAAAKGQWIARQDADDISLPDRLARQIAFLERHPSCTLLGTGCTLIDERGTLGRSFRFPTGHDALIRQMSTGGSPFPHASAMFRREYAVAAKGYNSRFVRSQDVDMWLRLSRVGQIASLAEPLVKLRKHGKNISNYSAGATQIIMGMAAQVCHLLRQKGASDPSQNGSDAVWNGFLCWLTERLEQQAYCASRREWSDMRQRCLGSVSSGHRCRGVIEMVRTVLMSPNVRRFLWRKLFKSHPASRLTGEWILGQAVESENKRKSHNRRVRRQPGAEGVL